jgi:hypothetical protein
MHKHLLCSLVLIALAVSFALPMEATELRAQEKLRQKQESESGQQPQPPSSKRSQERPDRDNPVFSEVERNQLLSVAQEHALANEERLRELLREYSTRFPGLISAAGVNLRREPGDFHNKRNAAIWQYACVSNVNSITIQPNPRVALIDLVTYTTRAVNYVESPEGRKFLGDYASQYSEVMKTADKWAWWLADFVLGEQEYQTLHTEVLAWCKENPMTNFMGRESIGVFAGDRFVPPPSSKLGDSLFFGGLEEGIDNTYTELQQANRTLDNFYVLMDWMPVYGYWTGEIALYSMLESEAGQGLLSFIDGLDETQQRLNETAQYFSTLNDFFEPFAQELAKPEYQSLPADLMEAAGRLDQVEKGLNSLLNDAGGQPLGARIASIDDSLKQLAAVGEELGKLGPVLDELDKPEELRASLEGMALRLIVAFCLCLLVTQVVAAWLIEKIRRKPLN